jgi:hypothetical protein
MRLDDDDERCRVRICDDLTATLAFEDELSNLSLTPFKRAVF